LQFTIQFLSYALVNHQAQAAKGSLEESTNKSVWWIVQYAATSMLLTADEISWKNSNISTTRSHAANNLHRINNPTPLVKTR